MLDLFDEFFRVIAELNAREVPYAVVGGIAMAFHAEPRFTKDIDLLVSPESLETVERALDSLGYFQSTQPWAFKEGGMTLNRYAKMDEGTEDFLMVDLLVGSLPEHRAMLGRATLDQSKAGPVRLATREDLIALKRARNSDQDQVDIRRLSRDQD